MTDFDDPSGAGPPSDEERARADALRRALDGAGGEAGERAGEVDALVRLAESLRAASGKAEPLEPGARTSIVDAALEVGLRKRRRAWRPAIVAAAAAVLLAVGGAYLLGAPSGGLPEEAYSAPTDALFDAPFPEDQTAAERLDRIVSARTRGYFAALAEGER